VSARKYAVFVSYSRRDKPIVSAAVQLMRAVGATTFQDVDSIPPGDIWREVIFTTIKSARSVIVFWSRNSAASAAVRAEWTQGVHLNKRIIPVLLDSTPLDPRLAKYQWLDWRVFSVAGVEEGEQGTLQEKLAESSFPVNFLSAVTELLGSIYTED
jgi:TIR domain-containing protein